MSDELSTRDMVRNWPWLSPLMTKAENDAIIEDTIQRHNAEQAAKWQAGGGDISMGTTIEMPYPGWPT